MRRSAVIWALLCCVVLVNGLMAAPSVSHAGHHEDHQATTHSTEMCAWFCAAAQESNRRPCSCTHNSSLLSERRLPQVTRGFFRLLSTLVSVDLLFPLL